MKSTLNVTEITLDELEELKGHWDKFSSCYFWSSPGSADARRREERRQYRHEMFYVNGHLVDVSIEVSCSCKNYYCTRSLTVDGEKKAQGGRYMQTLINKGIFA